MLFPERCGRTRTALSLREHRHDNESSRACQLLTRCARLATLEGVERGGFVQRSGERAMRMRLQRVLAQAGLASRRQGETWIQAGRVSVNGKVVTTPGTQADPTVDRIAVDGKVINRLEPKVYYLLNKPAGYVSTC